MTLSAFQVFQGQSGDFSLLYVYMYSTHVEKRPCPANISPSHGGVDALTCHWCAADTDEEPWIIVSFAILG